MSNKRDGNAMVKLIEKGPSTIYESKNVLARLWRVIFFDHDITRDQFLKLMARYQRIVTRAASDKVASNIKGNLCRRLAEDKLTWEGIIRGIQVLGYEHVRFEIHLTKRGQTTVHYLEAETEALMDSEYSEKENDITVE